MKGIMGVGLVEESDAEVTAAMVDRGQMAYFCNDSFLCLKWKNINSTAKIWSGVETYPHTLLFLQGWLIKIYFVNLTWQN